jgi:hypothetical protein
VRQFFWLPTATLAANPPPGTYHAVQTPGLPGQSVVVVEGWTSHAGQDAWEALPGVTEFYIENWNQPVAAAAVTAFAPWGVVATDTVRQALRKIRAYWPMARL